MRVTVKVFDLLERVTGKKGIVETDSLKETLGLDSLGMVMLLLEVEEEFNIQLKESDMNPFSLQTVADLRNLVEKYSEGHHA